jgi:hypothetical protein
MTVPLGNGIHIIQHYLADNIDTRMIYKIIMTTINYFETFASVTDIALQKQCFEKGLKTNRQTKAMNAWDV